MGSGIPVPPVIPEGSKAFILCVPDDPFFYGVVMGALKVMTFKYYWSGTDEEKTAVTDRMLTMYYNYQEQVGCVICDLITECLEAGDEALIQALADLIANNETLQLAIAAAAAAQGGYTPGLPLTPGQAGANLLPANVKDEEGNCVPNNLWGAMLYLVQSGNRLITDFFDVLEAASNTLEATAIVTQAIPAAGDYISSAAEFADQLLENVSEGYAAAYTEAYEQGLACDLFCLARSGCDLSLDAIIAMLNGRLAEPFGIGDFGEMMVGIASRTWVGDELADVAFMCFFGAVKFGQQFADQFGVRPLPVLMSLGADQLSSDNWITLCEDCPEPPTVIGLLNPDTGITTEYELGVEHVITSVDASGDNRIFWQAEGCFFVEVVSATGYNPSPFLQTTNYWYGLADCEGGSLTLHNASGTGTEQPDQIDTGSGVSQYVVSNAGLGAWSMTVIFTVP